MSMIPHESLRCREISEMRKPPFPMRNYASRWLLVSDWWNGTSATSVSLCQIDPVWRNHGPDDCEIRDGKIWIESAQCSEACVYWRSCVQFRERLRWGSDWVPGMPNELIDSFMDVMKRVRLYERNESGSKTCFDGICIPPCWVLSSMLMSSIPIKLIESINAANLHFVCSSSVENHSG